MSFLLRTTGLENSRNSDLGPRTGKPALPKAVSGLLVQHDHQWSLATEAGGFHLDCTLEPEFCDSDPGCGQERQNWGRLGGSFG